MTAAINKIAPPEPTPSRRVQIGTPIPRPNGPDEAWRRLREWNDDKTVPAVSMKDPKEFLRNVDAIAAGTARPR